MPDDPRSIPIRRQPAGKPPRQPGRYPEPILLEHWRKPPRRTPRNDPRQARLSFTAELPR
jgi:hypothetical protein